MYDSSLKVGVKIMVGAEGGGGRWEVVWIESQVGIAKGQELRRERERDKREKVNFTPQRTASKSPNAAFVRCVCVSACLRVCMSACL